MMTVAYFDAFIITALTIGIQIRILVLLQPPGIGSLTFVS